MKNLKKYFAFVSIFYTSSFFLTLLFAQSVERPPSVQWDFTSSSTMNGFGNDDDWALNVLHDGR